MRLVELWPKDLFFNVEQYMECWLKLLSALSPPNREDHIPFFREEPLLSLEAPVVPILLDDAAELSFSMAAAARLRHFSHLIGGAYSTTLKLILDYGFWGLTRDFLLFFDVF